MTDVEWPDPADEPETQPSEPWATEEDEPESEGGDAD
jgi:hypothetical protein